MLAESVRAIVVDLPDPSPNNRDNPSSRVLTHRDPILVRDDDPLELRNLPAFGAEVQRLYVDECFL